jgi:hypothetical protein
VFAEKPALRAGALGALFVASLASTGCIVETGDSAPPPVVVVEPGRLTVRWMVDEAVDPNRCVLGRAAAIAVSTIAGRTAGEFQAPCTAFATTISSLYPGDYVADALLLDSAGRPRTTAVEIRPFTVIDRTDLVIDVDFPADSFLDSLDREVLGRADEESTRAASPSVLRAPPAVPSASPGDGVQPNAVRNDSNSPEETR